VLRCGCSGEEPRGSILLMTAFSLFALLLVIGLAIDAGNLYRSRLAMQRAADAATLAAVNYITNYGKMKLEEQAGILQATPDEKKAALTPMLTTKAVEIIRANLASAGLADTAANPLSIQGEYLPAGDAKAQSTSAYEFRITLTRPIDYLLMGRLPFIQSTRSDITVSSTARRRIANIAMILDVSDSMGCPEGGSCDCMLSGAIGGTTCSGPRKMDKMLEGVGEFLHHLDLAVDRVAIVPFNMTSNVLTKDSLQQMGIVWPDNPPISVIDDVVDAIKRLYIPGSSTNMCDAFMRAQKYARNDLHVPDGEPIAYVLFSDGGPTAGEFLFNDVKADLPPWPAAGTYDYTSTSVAWLDDSNNVRPGPGLLVQSGAYYMNYPLAWPPEPNNPLKPNSKASVALCGAGALTYPPQVFSDPEIETAAQKVFAPCLKSFRAYVPGGKDNPKQWYDANYSTAEGAVPGAKDWRETYYNCAIELSDWMREDGGTFFSIGLGVVNDSVDPDDPYQNVGDARSLKSAFLSRVSLDMKAGKGMPPFQYQGYEDYEAAYMKTPDKGGDFLATPTDTDIPLMFQRIVHRLLLKLVS
jgi:Flp pilus assembly protein TadG